MQYLPFLEELPRLPGKKTAINWLKKEEKLNKSRTLTKSEKLAQDIVIALQTLNFIPRASYSALSVEGPVIAPGGKETETSIKTFVFEWAETEISIPSIVITIKMKILPDSLRWRRLKKTATPITEGMAIDENELGDRWEVELISVIQADRTTNGVHVEFHGNHTAWKLINLTKAQKNLFKI